MQRQENKETHLSIVIVNTNTRDLVSQCLESMRRYPPDCPFEAIVVDNASLDGSCEAIESQYPEVRLIRNSENVGFAVANNQALAVARGEYLLLLNSDTVVMPGSLDALLGAAASDPQIGIAAPKLVYPDGSLQMSFGPIPDLFVTFCTFFEVKRLVPRGILSRMSRLTAGRFLGKAIAAYASWFSGKTPPAGKLAKHLYVTGACMLIRRGCFEQVGYLDPGYFMYVDDADYCQRVHDAGWGILYVADATIVHVKGGTVGERYRWTSAPAYRSLLHFMYKHRGPGGFRVAKILALFSLFVRSTWHAVTQPHQENITWQLLKDVANSAQTTRGEATNKLGGHLSLKKDCSAGRSVAAVRGREVPSEERGSPT